MSRSSIKRRRMMKRTIRSVAWVAVAGMAALVLACPSMVREEEPPRPTLQGTWETVTEWEDGDGDRITSTHRLVFSESGKAFWHATRFDLLGHDRHAPYGHIADWTVTEDTITKTFIHDNDDDGQWESGTIDKSYYLTDSGNVLFVHHWESDQKEDAFERYTRVQDPVTSNPTLLGTWERDGVRWGDDGPEGGTKVTLTFTEDRWILVETPLDEAGEVTDHSAHSGAWTPVTESSATKTFVSERHGPDDGTGTVKERSFDKHYAWGAGGELFVIEWRGDWEDASDAASPGIERYRRVENPLPSLEGVWVWRTEWERDDGQVFVFRVTLTIGETIAYLWEEGSGGVFDFSYLISGSWRRDESKQFMILDNPDAVPTNPEWSPEEVDFWTREHKGHPLRLAYASAGAPDRMVISSWHREQIYDAATNTYADSNFFPYGGYHRAYVKQP